MTALPSYMEWERGRCLKRRRADIKAASAILGCDVMDVGGWWPFDQGVSMVRSDGEGQS